MSNVVEFPKADEKRWTARVYYRTENGIQRVVHNFAELSELHQVIEDDSLIEDLHVRWSEDVKPRRCQVAVLSTMVMAA